jgi:hypothetical protein
LARATQWRSADSVGCQSFLTIWSDERGEPLNEFIEQTIC